MNIIERSLQFRLNVGRFLNAWLRPWVIQISAERSALNDELKRHWPERAFTVQELIREDWELAADKVPTSVPKTLQFLVFIDSEGDIDWFTDGDLGLDAGKSVSAAEAVGARRCKHLPHEQRLEFRRMVGLAIVEGIRGNRDESLLLANEAAKFLKERTIERSRCWTLYSAHVLLLGLSAVLWLVWYGFSPVFVEHVKAEFSLCVSIQGGLIGAYLSVLQKAGKGAWDAASGLWIHILEVFSKVFAGSVCGGIAFILSRSVHAPASIRGLTSDLYSIFLFGIAAGLFERVIPKMVSAYVEADKTKGSNDP